MSTTKIGSSDNNLGSRLRCFRLSLSLTQSKLAEPLSISGSYVSDIEKGKAIPSEAVIREIVEKYRLTRLWLETGAGEMYAKNKFQEFAEDRETQVVTEHHQIYGVTGVIRQITPEQEDLLRCWDQMDEGKRQSLMDVARSMAGFVVKSKKSGNEENGSPGLKSSMK